MTLTGCRAITEEVMDMDMDMVMVDLTSSIIILNIITITTNNIMEGMEVEEGTMDGVARVGGMISISSACSRGYPMSNIRIITRWA